MNSKPAFIDLFCGCGGFTLGMERAGVKAILSFPRSNVGMQPVTLQRHVKRVLEWMKMNCKPAFIDLFCGCGGFTLGMERAGFRCVAAVDFNAEAVDTLRRNLTHIKYVLERDLTQFRPVELAAMIGVKSVDVIVGGPPCQGFSTARQVDGANHGERLTQDLRRHLYQELLKYVDYFKPKVFVMENVLGIKTAAGGEYFVRVQSEARALG